MKSLWEEVKDIKKRIFEGEDINRIKRDLLRLKEEVGIESFEKIMLLINNSVIEKKGRQPETIQLIKNLNNLGEQKQETYLSTQEYLKIRTIVEQKRQPKN